ncbi:MAG: EAL domain-containing protein, partial [Gemmatimonadetes bacterium]
FAAEMRGQPRDAGLVRAIIDLAHDLGMQVVAEGVETKAQAELLTELGCEHAQGFLWAHPVPLEDAEAILLAGRVEG